MRIDCDIDMNEEFQAENESRFCLRIYICFEIMTKLTECYTANKFIERLII